MDSNKLIKAIPFDNNIYVLLEFQKNPREWQKYKISLQDWSDFDRSIPWCE